MTDKNNIEMKAGDIVKISGAYTKRHNGYFLITDAPGDCTWCGLDYALKRINRNGSFSKNAYSTQFWPLCYFSNNRDHNYAAREHDEKNATIEIVSGIDKKDIIAYFRDKIDGLEGWIERYTWDFGKNSEYVKNTEDQKKHYESVIARIEN